MNRDELYRIWKAEKSEKTLQKLPAQFYTEVRKLLSECKASSAATGQDRTQKAITEREFKILQRLSTEIAKTRMKKIVDAVLSGQNVATEMLAEEEAEFAKIVATHVGDYYHFVDELVLFPQWRVHQAPVHRQNDSSLLHESLLSSRTLPPPRRAFPLRRSVRRERRPQSSSCVSWQSRC